MSPLGPLRLWSLIKSERSVGVVIVTTVSLPEGKTARHQVCVCTYGSRPDNYVTRLTRLWVFQLSFELVSIGVFCRIR